jgi:hypothetical protein
MSSVIGLFLLWVDETAQANGGSYISEIYSTDSKIRMIYVFVHAFSAKMPKHEANAMSGFGQISQTPQ